MNLTNEWDVVVIGTGMGGATAGQVLAKKGFSVLFLEKGAEIKKNVGWTDEPDPTKRLQQGWWPTPASQKRKDGGFDRHYIAVGCARGGSSIHYGGALERFEASDFDVLKTEQQNQVSWPITFEQILPFYKKAENLYGISKAKPALSEWDESFVKILQANKLKPERLNVSINYDKDCTECIGKICHRKCKSDAKTACLDQALQEPNCHILDNCEVMKLDADSTNINRINALHNEKKIELKAKIVILSAGAMHSPALLLKSKNKFWPKGLANSSDQVGRNLMFHVGDMYAVWSQKKLSRKGLQKKSISIRDFYVKDGQRLGHIQSLGLNAGEGHIAMVIKDVLRRYGIHNELLLSLISKIPAKICAKLLGEATLFGVNIEDDPNPDNRIVLNQDEPSGTSFTYKITDDIQKRANILYQKFSKGIKPWRSFRIMPSIEINNGHSCGTCRFGTDPSTSVLNADCRSHDIKNLYVIDASFMPRSGAANPSLTIAANALRVAEIIANSPTLKPPAD